MTYLGRLSKYGHQQQARPDRNTTRSVAVSKKADRTVYDVWYRCRTELQKCRVWNSHGHTTMLPMAIPDEEISAVHWLCEQIMEWSCCSSRNPQPHEDFDTDTLSVLTTNHFPDVPFHQSVQLLATLALSVLYVFPSEHGRGPINSELYATLSCATDTGHAVLVSRMIDNTRRLTKTKKYSSIRRNY